MIREEHLELYDLILTVKAPLFVGSGKSYVKKAYLFLSPEITRSPGAKVMLLDEGAFFRLLVERNLVDQYERFMLSAQTDCFRFLTSDCHLTMREISAVSRYTIDVEDALDRNHSLKEIHAFVRDACGRAYVPGSSVKGALRTALLTDLVLQTPEQHSLPDPRRGFPEGQFLHTLSLKKDKSGVPLDDAVNSILRGLYISDSLPVDDSSMMLAGKIDADICGETHKINLCRECIKPGTQLRFKLTLDRSVLKDRITADSLMESIQAFDRFYEDAWLRAFQIPARGVDVVSDSYLVLGGGAGYAAKTLVYPYLDERAGVREVSQILSRAFPRHRHEHDLDAGISPRMAKYAQFRGSLYPYGLCEVSLS